MQGLGPGHMHQEFFFGGEGGGGGEGMIGFRVEATSLGRVFVQRIGYEARGLYIYIYHILDKETDTGAIPIQVLGPLCTSTSLYQPDYQSLNLQPSSEPCQTGLELMIMLNLKWQFANIRGPPI